MGMLRSMLCAVLLLWGTTVPACEPAPVDEFVARMVSMTDRGPEVDVIVDLKLVPSVDVPLARVHGSLAGGTGSARALADPDRLASLRRNEPRTFRYALTLGRGALHHLVFDVRSEDRGGPPFEAHAYLRVNLDPSLEPEDLGDVLQYRVGTKREVTQ